MKAAYKLGDNIEIRNVPYKKPGIGQIRLRIDACGICGTDIHSEEIEYSRFGHEIAGEIIGLGEGVDYLEIGQQIVLDSATPCGRCDMCRNMHQELCTNIQSFYFLDEFGFAEEMNAPAVSAIPYEGLDPEVALLQEPLGVALDLCRVSDIRAGMNVLIVGQGPIGLMAGIIARQQGAGQVFVSDFAEKTARKKMAEDTGADAFIDAASVSIDKYDFPCQIHRVLVTAPPPLLVPAVAVAAKGGIVSFIGIGQGDQAFCSFNANDFHFKKLQLRSSFASPALMGPMALSYLKYMKIPWEKFISHRYPLLSLKEALNTAKHDPEALKVIISNRN